MNKDNKFMNFIHEKKAEKILSIWWFFVLVIIGGGIVLGTLIYHSTETSVKKVEAEILNEKIFDCIMMNNYLNSQIFDKSSNIFEKCGLDENVFKKGSNFFFRISLYSNDKIINEIIQGDSSFEKNCYIVEKVSAKRFPGCYLRNESVFDKEEKEFRLIILTASGQEGERISVVG